MKRIFQSVIESGLDCPEVAPSGWLVVEFQELTNSFPGSHPRHSLHWRGRYGYFTILPMMSNSSAISRNGPTRKKTAGVNGRSCTPVTPRPYQHSQQVLVCCTAVSETWERDGEKVWLLPFSVFVMQAARRDRKLFKTCQFIDAIGGKLLQTMYLWYYWKPKVARQECISTPTSAVVKRKRERKKKRKRKSWQLNWKTFQ